MSQLDRAYREVAAEASRSDHAEAPARGALLSGVLVSGALLTAGLLAVLLGHQHRPDLPPSIGLMLRGLARAQGTSLLYAGLLILAATPILRVVVMAWVYFRRREWFMLAVSLIVLLLLGVGLLLGTG